ncbi:hypothetical protein C4E15_05930 [Achromobacter spanius]|uniref:Uncharacterized protein n=1 Tax=Achromobacter spanius TaxID=217203 RepID=A0A2K8S0R3_9BURK|nr:hypothetical protein CVS48_08170 [Achromobacter spanius]PPA77556.1 hypothetical protein C4E15_05930 [Achromobacter spanius]
MMGQVSLTFDEGDGRNRAFGRLAIDMGLAKAEGPVTAKLDVASMRQLVDGMMEAMYAIERTERLEGQMPDLQAPSAYELGALTGGFP